MCTVQINGVLMTVTKSGLIVRLKANPKKYHMKSLNDINPIYYNNANNIAG